MAHNNRGHIMVCLGGPWRLYTHPLSGWQMLGTVQRGMEIGALGRSPAGIYAQINAGCVRTLDQRKIAAAIAANSPGGAVVPDA